MSPNDYLSKVNKTDTCWIWTGAKTTSGYGIMRIPGNKFMRVHRYSYEHNIGPIPDGLMVLHRCDNPSCCNPDHLFLGTQLDNMKDMYKKGRNTRGVSILSDTQISEIRLLYNSGTKLNDLVGKYPVSYQTLRRVALHFDYYKTK